MLAQIKKNDDVKRAYGRMFAYDVPSENSGKSYNANLISYEENQFQWAADSLVAGSIETVMQQENQVLFVQTGNVNVQVGDKITLSINNTKKTVTVAGILSDSPLARVKGTETFFCSEATFSALTGETGYTIIDIQFENNASSEDVNAIKNIFTNGGVIFSDSLSQVQQQRNLYYTFAVLGLRLPIYYRCDYHFPYYEYNQSGSCRKNERIRKYASDWNEQTPTYKNDNAEAGPTQ